MRFAAEKDELAEAVAWATKVIAAKPSHPVLFGVHMEVIQDQVLLSAFNDVVSARTTVEVKDAEPGVLVVSGKLLSEALKNMPEGLVEVGEPEGDEEADGPQDTRVRIIGGGAGYQLETIPPMDFPRLPTPPPVHGWIEAKDFRSAVSQVRFGIGDSDESTDMRLDGIRMEISGPTATFISTNLFRIPVARQSWRWEGEEAELSATVPPAALAVMASVAKGPVGFSFPGERGVLGLTCGKYVITSGVLAGRYPPWQRAFALVGTQMVAEVDRDELTSALKRATVVQEPNASVTLTFSPDGLQVEAGTRSAMTEALAAEVRGEPMVCSYNMAYLLKALEVAPTTRVVLQMNRDAAGMVLATGEVPSYQQLISAQVA